MYPLSKAPIGIAGGLNQYVFCGNNPVNFVDPSGLCGDALGEYAMSSPSNPWQNFNPLNSHFLLYKMVGALAYGFREFGVGLTHTFRQAKDYARLREDKVALYSIYAVEPVAYFSKGAAETSLLTPLAGVPGMAEVLSMQATYGVGKSAYNVGSSLMAGQVPASEDVYGTVMPMFVEAAADGGASPLLNHVRGELVLNHTLSPGPGTR